MADRVDARLARRQGQLIAVGKAQGIGKTRHAVHRDRPLDRLNPGQRAGQGQRRLFQGPRHLFGRAVVHAGMGCVRQRHRIPFLGREGGPGLHELRAPQPGPGQTRDQEHHQNQADPKANRPVQRFPERPAPGAGLHRQRLAPALARPVQVDPRQDQQQPQTCRRLDHPVPGIAHQQRPVDVGHEIVPSGAPGELVQHLARIGVQGDAGADVIGCNDDGRDLVGRQRGDVLGRRRPRQGGFGGCDQRADGKRLVAARDGQLFIADPGQDGDPQHHQAGRGQHDQKGNGI